jgi:hypothetical protein
MLSPQRKSRRQEDKIASRFGGLRVAGSGNGWARKNDVRTPEYSIEAKYTDKAQYILKQDELHVAENHALQDNREMLFVVSFGGEEWVVLREPVFRWLTEGGQSSS